MGPLATGMYSASHTDGVGWNWHTDDGLLGHNIL